MKKITINFLFLLLVCAVIVITGCPSDPAIKPQPPIEDPDLEISGGAYIHVFDTPKVEQDKTYTVTFMIISCEDDFISKRMGGKLAYKNDPTDENEDDNVLSGWTYCSPAVVNGPGIYRWTFKAGQKNDDDLNCAVPATTPDGAQQYFSLTAQTNNWAQLPSDSNFKFKGTITVTEKIPPTGTLQLSSELTRTYTGSGNDATIGKGNLETEEFDKVKNASNGAVLRFYVTDCAVTATSRDEGWGIASAGNFENVGSSNPNAMVKIPKSATVGTSSSFTVDLPVEDALLCVRPTEPWLFINVWDCKVLKLELWEYK